MKGDYRLAPLSARQRALCEFAEKITRTPADIRSSDLDALRARGLSDCDIVDAVQVISYFSYINRVADALGIDPEPEMQEAWQSWRQARGTP